MSAGVSGKDPVASTLLKPSVSMKSITLSLVSYPRSIPQLSPELEADPVHVASILYMPSFKDITNGFRGKSNTPDRLVPDIESVPEGLTTAFPRFIYDASNPKLFGIMYPTPTLNAVGLLTLAYSCAMIPAPPNMYIPAEAVEQVDTEMMATSEARIFLIFILVP